MVNEMSDFMYTGQMGNFIFRLVLKKKTKKNSQEHFSSQQINIAIELQQQVSIHVILFSCCLYMCSCMGIDGSVHHCTLYTAANYEENLNGVFTSSLYVAYSLVPIGQLSRKPE